MVAAVRVVLAACLLGFVSANSPDRTKADGLDKITITITRAKLEKKYVLRTIQVNWFAAFQMCLAEGKRLATVTSQEDTMKVKKLITDSRLSPPAKLWMSLTDLAKQGTYVWMSTGDPVGYTNWAYIQPFGQQPDNSEGREHCGNIWFVYRENLETVPWNDSPCEDIHQGYICEYFEEA